MAASRKDRASISRLLGEAVGEAAGVVGDVIEQLPGGRPARVIKRYANRKLYDTTRGTFTTLAALEELVRDGIDVVVIDHDTGEDLTNDVLAQIVDRVARAERGSGSVLSSFIRSPDRVAEAIESDESTKEEVRELREQVAQLTALVEKLAADKGAAPSRPRRGGSSK